MRRCDSEAQPSPTQIGCLLANSSADTRTSPRDWAWPLGSPRRTNPGAWLYLPAGGLPLNPAPGPRGSQQEAESRALATVRGVGRLMPARLHHLRFQGPPSFFPHSRELCAHTAAPRTRETSGEGKEGTETVAPTHRKVLLNVIFQEFTNVLAEFLLWRGSVQSALLPPC